MAPLRGAPPRHHEVASPRVTVTSRVSPSRVNPSVAFEPGIDSPIRFRSMFASVTERPLNESTTSPLLRPARSAALCAATSRTTAPATFFSLRLAATSEVTGSTVMPRRARRTWPSARSSDMTCPAMFDGIAKPIPMLPPDGDRICELMPTSSPSCSRARHRSCPD